MKAEERRDKHYEEYNDSAIYDMLEDAIVLLRVFPTDALEHMESVYGNNIKMRLWCSMKDKYLEGGDEG